ncbi:MAG: sulfatase-like hydrolase/transferase [Halobacteriaceae archaeon]
MADESPSAASGASAGERPNVLLVLVDDLGYADLGCYGGEIATPNVDALADDGAQFGDFYVQPRCSPTRASLLTGHTNQRLGFDVLAGGRELRRNHVFLPELLRAEGYRTYLSGKWHLGGTANFGASPVERDPRVRGFDHAYRFTGYAESPWDPDARLLSHTPDTYRLLSDAVEERSYRHDPDSTRYEPGETFYQTDAIADYALDFLAHDRRRNEEAGERRPIFMYLAYGAPHFPLAAPRSLVDEYVSRYEAGWDAIREERLQRMVQRGVVPPDVALPPRSDVPAREGWDRETHRVPAWDSLSAERRADLARRMAVFAAMVEMVDRNVGRVLDDLAEHGQLDGTLVLFTSDNGACYEWHEFGHSDDDGPRTGAALRNMGTAAADEGLKYGAGWATVGSTPYRLYKHFGHEGGVRSPLLVRWEGLDDSLREGVVDGVACSRDLVPTLLDLLDVDLPDAWTAESGETYPVEDLDETRESLRDLLVDGVSVGDRDVAWEHEGNAAYRSGAWKAVGKDFAGSDGVPAHEWELYDLEADPTETTNLAADHPDRVADLARRWMDWAGRNDVPVPDGVTVPS